MWHLRFHALTCMMLRKFIQVFALYFIFNPALSFNLYIYLESGLFWFYLFTFVANLSPFPTLTVLLFKHFQPFTLSQSASSLTSTAASQIPWGLLNILLRSCRTFSCDDVVPLSLLWFPVSKPSHWQRAFMGVHLLSAMFVTVHTCPEPHLSDTFSVSLVYIQHWNLNILFPASLLFPVTTYHCHPFPLNTYTYFIGLWKI